MTRTLLTGNGAAAWGARLAEVDYVPAFPITPQTEIIEALAGWYERGEAKGRLVTLESEHSMLTAAGAAAATGVRVFTATSSQGLLYAMEMVYAVPGWRVPLVMVNVSRGVATPITLESDHTDILAARDSGFLQIHCATCQEVLDGVLIAYRVAEDARVRLPVIVNLDGFTLSFTREPVEIPDVAIVRRFLPAFDPQGIEFRASRPLSQAVAVLGGSPYSYFRYEAHLAAMNALGVYEEAARDFAALFGRDHASVEAYRCEDAQIVFFMIGAYASMRAMPWTGCAKPAGRWVWCGRGCCGPIPRPRCGRCSWAGGPIVVDQNLRARRRVLRGTRVGANGSGAAALSYIGGLAGDISAEEFFEMAAQARWRPTRASARAAAVYTADEPCEIRALQAVAHAERAETGATHG